MHFALYCNNSSKLHLSDSLHVCAALVHNLCAGMSWVSVTSQDPKVP